MPNQIKREGVQRLIRSQRIVLHLVPPDRLSSVADAVGVGAALARQGPKIYRTHVALPDALDLARELEGA